MVVEGKMADGVQDLPPGDNMGVQPKVMTEDEFNRRMAGLAKAKDRAEKEAAALRAEKDERSKLEKDAERRRLEKQGEYKQLLDQRDAELEKERAAREEIERKLQAYVDEISEENKERMKALPRDIREIAKAAEDLQPAALARVLGKLEAMNGGSRVRAIDGGGGRSSPEDKDADKEKQRESIRMRAAQFVLGGAK